MGSLQSTLRDEETARKQKAHVQEAEQQKQFQRQRQIDNDARVAHELMHDFDSEDYRSFRDRRIADRLARSDEEQAQIDYMDEDLCREAYTNALNAEHENLLSAQAGTTSNKRMKKDDGSASSGLEANAANPAGEQRNRKTVRNLECVVCSDTEPADQIITLSCNHDMCKTCTVRLFKGAMKDESLFPPRCCRTHEVPIELARPLLGDTLAARFEEKAVELRTQDRTYCHVPHCSESIKPESIVGNVGRCTDCWSRTCALCKGRRHKGEDCPLDEGRRQIEQMARENGWRQCDGCKRMVELNYGCFHMTFVRLLPELIPTS